jgi:hypothetical protein
LRRIDGADRQIDAGKRKRALQCQRQPLLLLVLGEEFEGKWLAGGGVDQLATASMSPKTPALIKSSRQTLSGNFSWMREAISLTCGKCSRISRSRSGFVSRMAGDLESFGYIDNEFRSS